MHRRAPSKHSPSYADDQILTKQEKPFSKLQLSITSSIVEGEKLFGKRIFIKQTHIIATPADKLKGGRSFLCWNNNFGSGSQIRFLWLFFVAV
jgi:hypothetical protein